jgi:hypothetical protein
MRRILDKICDWIGLETKPYRIYQAYKDVLIFQEKHRKLYFRCRNRSGPPFELEFPTSEAWINQAPTWVKERREEILAELKKRHDIKLVISDSAKIWHETLGAIG